MPNNADVTLEYECPKCGMAHFATKEETIFPAGVLCYCGAKLKFKPIYKIKLNFVCERGEKVIATKPQPQPKPKYKTEKIESEIAEATEDEVSTEVATDVAIDEAIAGLVNLGYRKSQAKKAAKFVAEHNQLATAEEILLAVLQQR